MYSDRPIIGLAGGIGSGKSHVAGLLREMGCFVIDSDAAVRAAYESGEVREALRDWWGNDVFLPDGRINRRAIASRVFAAAGERERLEQLIHPRVGAMRDREMAAAALDKSILAFVWDTPLLFEAGLSRECDQVIFIDSGLKDRVRRVAEGRGWSEEELLRRENLQWPLDKKRNFSHYVIQSAANADDLRAQVRDVLSRILANQQLTRTFGPGRM